MNSRTKWILLIVVFFLAGAAGTYLVLTKLSPPALQPSNVRFAENLPAVAEDLVPVRISAPRDGRIEVMEKRLPKRTRPQSLAEGALEEFLKLGGSPGYLAIPRQVKVLGVYRDAGQTLFVDLSDDARRNFQGDAADEYLFLKGLFETLTMNFPDIQDVKVLVEGKEIETLGGHFLLNLPLKATVMSGTASGGAPAHE